MRKTTTCRRCRHKLTNPLSVELGLGTICAAWERIVHPAYGDKLPPHVTRIIARAKRRPKK